jgi:hypothetical protein
LRLDADADSYPNAYAYAGANPHATADRDV